MPSPVIDYTDRDFDTIKEALLVHIQTKFPDTWRDFYESGMGMVWLELVAYVFDCCSYYMDYSANETYLPTARDRDSVLNLGKLVGYQMRPATSAAVDVASTIAAAQAEDVIVDRGTTVTSTGGVEFMTTESQRIPAGDTEATLTFTEGVEYSDSFTSDGSSFQKFQLTRASVISDSEAVTVAGEEWSLEDSLVYGSENSKIYTIEYDDDDYAYIQFGDNESGAVPPIGTAITVTYRTGGGVSGNIAVGEINTSIQGYLDGVAPTSYVSINLYNEERGSGGEPRETTEHAKYWIPYWVRTNNRAVTLSDFDTLANTFSDATYGAPAYAKAKLKQEIPELNTVEIYLWARDASGDITTPSTGLKNAISDYFNNNGDGAVRIVCTDVEVNDGELVYVDVDVSLKLESEYTVADVTDDVTDAIDVFFESTEVVPGKDFRLSHLYDSIQDTDGVDYLLVDQLTASSQVTETVGIGDGVETTFSVTLDLDPGLPIVEGSVAVEAGSSTVTDDGDGTLSNAAGDTGTINYETGALSVTFVNPVADGTSVFCEYRNILDYQRGEVETTADGTSGRFQGAVDYPPVVPYIDGEKGIAFTDGYQVVTDDGSGNLTGDVDASGQNSIDYDTGSYDFTFAVVPGAGQEIRSTYRQELQTASEDIPIGDYELAVKGDYTIATT